MALLIALLVAAPPFDAFGEPLDPQQWYVGVPQPPKQGWLRVPRDGWIVSRGIADDQLRELEVVFRHKGGALELTFHTAKEPLSHAQGPPLVVPRGKGVRTLVVRPGGAELDGARHAWKGTLRGTFRLRAVKGAVELDEVRVEPRAPAPAALDEFERNTVHLATTPRLYREGERTWSRVTLMLWDVEVSFLLSRGAAAFEPLQAPVKGVPVLGALVTAGEVDSVAREASAHPLAMRDWGDEQRNLSRGAFLSYLRGEYAVFALIQEGQRALNLAVPGRKGLEPLVHLAVIRHCPNARAATALAETQGARKALAALGKALGKGGDYRRLGGDKLRAAAAAAAREVLGEPPPQWPGFAFDPLNRFVTVEQAKELVR
ncbi:MAG: hypothetical protein ACYTEZ_04090 [Planctomycetota bacterium]